MVLIMSLQSFSTFLFTFIDYFVKKFDDNPEPVFLDEISEIISWNIFQMDGLKYVIPYSCHNEKKINTTLFETTIEEIECIGCKKDYIDQHNGMYCKVMDWNTGKKIKFIDLINKGEHNGQFNRI